MTKKDKENKIIQNINELINLNSSRKAKYYRNFRRYSFTPYASIENQKSPSIVGYWQTEMDGESDTNSLPQLNVIKSTIDTLTSKIAQSKVRPFFTTVNGTFKDLQIAKQSQQFFDLFFDQQDVNKTVSEAFRDSCIFDTGCIFIDKDERKITKALPWQVFTRPSERTYGKITRVYYEQKDYPVSLLPKEMAKKYQDKEYITFGKYYDTINEVYVIIIDGLIQSIEDYKIDVVPFIFLHYCNPIFGNSSQSIVDMLNSIQLEIDTLMSKIKDAALLNPAMTFFVPQDSDIKSTQLSNRIGNIITYKSTPNMTSSPVTVSTPAFIDAQYMTLVEQLKQTAYEMVGISQLSAQSIKPQGLDSGIALQTMENIESDRYETQLNAVIRSYVDIARVAIRVFPQDEDILPEAKTRLNVKWKEVVEQAEKMSIQFSGAEALSKDPSTKLQQLQLLAQAGVITKSRVAQLMEIPDLQSGYALSTNAIDAVLALIDRCLLEDDFNIPDFIPFTMLKEEIINVQLSLYKNVKENKGDLEKLSKLYSLVEEKEAEWQSTLSEEALTAQQLAQAEEPQNVLTQEAQLSHVVPSEETKTPEIVNDVDLAMDTVSGDEAAGGWNE